MGSASGSKTINLKGKQFGRWEVLGFDRIEQPSRVAFWHCRCSCGTVRSVKAGSLTQGKSISCGCARLDAVIDHGMTKTREFKSWDSMIQRCTNPKAPDFPKYGGRGITICPQWLESFNNFYRDMGDRPQGKSLDRLDVNGNYEPGNCRWATRSEQQRNKSNQIQVTAFGRTQTVGLWSLETGVDSKAIHWRIKTGWPPERAVTEPKAARKRRKAA